MNDTVSVRKAFELLNSSDDYILVDVRSSGEFNGLHAQQAIPIPLEQITSPASIDLLKNKKVLCICQSGARGKKATKALLACGLPEVSNVEGGTTAWKNAGFPVVTGKTKISIERQVRIVAGALVVIGTLLSLISSAYFLTIPVFIGSGLVFSGVTDTCGMGMILAKCPWNQS